MSDVIQTTNTPMKYARSSGEFEFITILFVMASRTPEACSKPPTFAVRESVLADLLATRFRRPVAFR